MNTQERWVLAWRPFNPSGLFVHQIGDLAKGDNAIVARYGVSHAMRMSRAEAQYLLDAINKAPGLTFGKKLVLVDLADHLFGEED